MSFKIYNGYKIPEFSLKELTAFHKSLYKKMENEKQNFCLSHISKMAALEIDFISLGINQKPNRWHVIQNIEFDFYKLVKTKEFYDLETSVVYYPLDGKILCQFYGMNIFKKVWEDSPEVSPYWYWDNVDADENCTEEEWNQRKKDWEFVFQDSGSTPISKGVTSLFTNSDGYLIKDYGVEGRKIASLCPSLDKRVELLMNYDQVRSLNLTKEEIVKRLIPELTYEVFSKGDGL